MITAPPSTQPAEIVSPAGVSFAGSRARVGPRSVAWGVVAAAGMLGFYVAVIAWASGWAHLADQIALDWYFLVLIIGGFGLQVGIMVELRDAHRMRAGEATAGGAGAGASTMGMLACCAHHLVDLAPIAGATGAAVFLASYRIPFMIAGIALNAVGVTIGLRRLRHTRAHHREHDVCATA